MERKQIIDELGKYFDIRELVCPHVFRAHGKNAWMFLQTPLLETILLLRTVVIGKPMLINNYPMGGSMDERGLRCNLCSIVGKKTEEDISYLSAHVTGAGIDFTVPGTESEDVRNVIRSYAGKYPHPIRLEKNVSWVHLDIYDPCNGRTINEFSV